MLISRMCTPLPVTLGLLLVGCGESPEIAVNPEQPALASEAGPPKTTSLTDIFPVGLGRQVVLDACGVCHARRLLRDRPTDPGTLGEPEEQPP